MTPYKYIRNCWYVAGLSKEFEPEKLTGHKIANRPMVIWRTKEGKVVAFDNRCAHKRFPLSEGRLMAAGNLECAYHGLRYNDAGRCIAIPSHPDGPIPPQAQLKPFPVIEQDELVWVWPGDPAKTSLRKPRVSSRRVQRMIVSVVIALIQPPSVPTSLAIKDHWRPIQRHVACSSQYH